MKPRWLAASFFAVLAGASLFFWSGRREKPHAPAELDDDSPVQETSEAKSIDRSSLQPITPAPSTDVVPRTEKELMQRLRALANAQPAVAIELAREGNRRFADSPDAVERTSILIHALAKVGHSAEARGEAETMVNHYPDSTWVREIEQFTGAHRHRNVRLDDAGKLEYVDPAP